MNELARRVVVMCACAFVTGCGPMGDPAGTPGATRNGAFVYCDPEGECSDRIPDAIAVGASFTLFFTEYFWGLTSSFSGTLEPDAGGRLSTVSAGEGTTLFRAIAPGAAAVDAVYPRPSRVLVDYTTVQLVDVASLRVQECSRDFNAITSQRDVYPLSSCAGPDRDTTTLDVSRGASLAPTVCVLPVDDAGHDLAGQLDYEWTDGADGTAQLEMHLDHARRCLTVGGLTLGTSELSVRAAGVTAHFTVNVTP
jgi:hypothetical protein